MNIYTADIFEAIRTRSEGEYFSIRLSDKSKPTKNSKFYDLRFKDFASKHVSFNF